MNDTVIKTNVVSKLKQLVQDIEALQDCNIAFGLNFEQEIRLAKFQIEINQIIKEL
jgi:hypothetical protein